MTNLEPFRFRSEKGIFKFLDKFNKSKQAKNILTFVTSLIFLVNIYSLKIDLKDLIKSVLDPTNITNIISINLILSNIYHVINSQLSLTKMNYKEEMKKKKNLIQKIWFTFTIYEVGYLPYEMTAFLFMNYYDKNSVVSSSLRYFFILRNIPFYLLSIFKNSQLNNNNNFKDIFEMFHALSGIYIMYQYRFNEPVKDSDFQDGS
jgi:hypothetical protein